MKEIKIFEEMIEKLGEIGNIEDKTERSKAYHELENSIPEDKLRVFHFYAEAKDRRNDYLDVDDWSDDRVAELLEQFRKCGIDKITVSSSWSGCPSLMYEFVKNGCTIEGMVEINLRTKNWETGEFDKKPAFLLAI